MNLHLQNLTIDYAGGDADEEVMLTQDHGGDSHYVSLHPSQMRLVAERMGLLPSSSNLGADKTVKRLSRQLRLLADRIDKMDDMFLGIGAKGHECVDEERAYSEASMELAREFVDQLDELEAGNTPETGAIAPANPPKSGDIARVNPPNNGGVSAQLPLGEGGPNL